MSSYTIPEEIIGVPLFVPDGRDYFAIDTGAMPNGDDCLTVQGNVSDTYLALINAPVFPVDILHFGDQGLTLPNNGWAISMWTKTTTLAASAIDRVMVGCMNINNTGLFADGANTDTAFAIGTAGGNTSGINFYRAPRNNVASPDHLKCMRAGVTATSGVWMMSVWNVFHTPPSGDWTINVFLNSSAVASASDTAAYTGAGGAYGATQYLAIGAYGSTLRGRNDEWRIGKLAFHDHPLNATERAIMYNAMTV